MEKKQIIKGLIKGVPSGDHVLIHKSTKAGPAKEIPAYLASIIAPKMGSTNRVEEPFAFDAREFLREKIIGKKCEFIQEYTYSGREYGTLMIENENINIALVKQGLAKVLEKKGNMPASSNYDDLMNA